MAATSLSLLVNHIFFINELSINSVMNGRLQNYISVMVLLSKATKLLLQRKVFIWVDIHNNRILQHNKNSVTATVAEN